MVTNADSTPNLHPTCMESINRITKLPVVDSTIKTATTIYERVKDINGLTHWTLSTAETTLCKAVNISTALASPICKSLECPIRKVDNVLCSGLDYIEDKVPAVKLPAGKILYTTKDIVSSTVSPVVKTAKALAQPAVDTALIVVEPLMQPALDKAQDVLHKVDEYLYAHHSGGVVECLNCQEIRRKADEVRRRRHEENVEVDEPEVGNNN